LEISEVPALLGAKITPELLASSISEMASVGGGQQHVTRLVAIATLRPSDGGAAAAATNSAAAAAGASSLHNAIKNLTATMACKAAVKAGQRLPDSEREHLVRLICSRWSSLSCPHGRPTVVRLGPGELEKMFLRT
ncbi:MAG: hypothetical protein M3R04_06310, partial [bacterium]|nr:hypothetical protein [bacterium]